MSRRRGDVRRAATMAAGSDVTVTLPRGHAVLLLRLVEREARARRRRAARSGFVPRPGKTNADEATAATLEAVAAALRAGPGRRQ